ncbi:ORF V: Enzymatic polyprotein [Labeo rohita]|uniref:ORF V: Enzymatic polyprotein n=1 Tax=Labeo rohita TaxID=84645 RepID=A0ABQ8L696_LABRO|nr:ORF V: Enzymatic polyprotein [Labeo rohita]
MSRLPLSSSCGKSLSRQGFSATAARHLGDIQVTVQNAPSAPKAPRTSVSRRGPVELPEQYTSPYSGLGVSFGAPQDVEMSAATSEGEPGGEADDSADRYPSAVAAPSETDAELSAMLLRAAKEIGLEVPKTPPADPSRLDDWFLGRAPAALPRSPPVPFFPEVHEELGEPRTLLVRVPAPLPSPLSMAVQPGVMRRSLRSSALSRACKFSSALTGRAYHAAGHAATALHAMATLQVYQAKVLKHLHEKGSDQGAMEELRAATDFALRATKVTARSLGQVMSTIVVQERHLWLTLAQMADVDKSRFLDAPISQSGLFGDTVEDSAEDLFSRRGAGLGQYDSPPHQRAHAVSAEVSGVIQTQNSGPSQNISEAPGAYGSRSRSDAARPASYETASALVTRSSPEMGMAPWHTPDWRFPAVSPPVQPVVRPGLPSGWSPPGTSLQASCELFAVLLALRRFRPTLRHKHVLVRTDSTATVAYINRQGGLRSRRMSQLARHLLLWSQTWLKSLRAVHIPGELNRAADQLSRQSTHPGEWRLHPETVQLISSHFGEAQIDLFASPESSHCQRFYSLNEAPNSLGRDALAHSWPPGPKYAFPPVSLLAQTLQDQGGRGAGSAGCAILAHPDLVSRTHFPRSSPSLENPLEERPSFSGDGHNLAPAPRPVEPARLAVIETITQSRASSTRQAYALRWGLFVDWCSSRGEDPQRCTIAVVLSFLQEKLERRLSPSTLKVYVAAIAAYHDAVDGTSLRKHQLIGLREAPFEPLASVELKYLSLKTALLTALASIKRVGDLQAFSVDEVCLEFGPGDSHVILRPRPGYVPKVPTTPFRDQVVNLQALPLEEADPASALLCPVRALRIYVDRTRHFRRTEQLFVCFGGQQKGNAVSKQRLAHWVVDAISLSYQNQGEPCPLGVRAHSTRSVASSYALAHGASLADICRAADITGEREPGWCRLAAPFLMDPCAISLSCSLRRTWVLHAPQSGLVRSSACLCSGWVSFAQQVVATCFSIFPRDFMCSPPPQLLLQYNWHPCGAPYWPPGRWEGYAHIRLLTRPPVGTRLGDDWTLKRVPICNVSVPSFRERGLHTVMSWKEDTVADIVQNNMDSQEDTADLERESATEDSGLNFNGPEDTRVNLEGTETSDRLPVSLYLDATGGVVSKIADQPKRILYYSLTLPGKGWDTPPFTNL